MFLEARRQLGEYSITKLGELVALRLHIENESRGCLRQRVPHSIEDGGLSGTFAPDYKSRVALTRLIELRCTNEIGA